MTTGTYSVTITIRPHEHRCETGSGETRRTWTEPCNQLVQWVEWRDQPLEIGYCPGPDHPPMCSPWTHELETLTDERGEPSGFIWCVRCLAIGDDPAA